MSLPWFRVGAIAVVVVAGFVFYKSFVRLDPGDEAPNPRVPSPDQQRPLPRGLPQGVPKSSDVGAMTNAELRAWVSHPQTWKKLPSDVWVEVDANGEVEYLSRRATYGNFAEFQKSVEEIAKDPVTFLSGNRAHRVLKDRKGRLWVSWRGDCLFCFDGSQWKEARSANSDAADAPMLTADVYGKSRKPEAAPLEFTSSAFEDSAGNLHFLVSERGRANGAVHTRWADGHWSLSRLTLKTKEALLQRTFQELKDGRIVATSKKWGRGPDELLMFDGKTWAVAPRLVCPNPSHEITRVIAYPDGHLLVGCAAAAHVWECKLSDLPLKELEESMDTIMTQFKSLDPEIRKAAAAKIRRMGIGADRPLCQMEADPKVSAELKREVPEFRRGIRVDQYCKPMTFTGVTIEEARLMEDAVPERMKILVRGVQEGNGEMVRNRDAMLVRQADGSWTLMPRPLEKIDPMNAPRFDMARELANGEYVFATGEMMSADFRVLDSTPAGVTPPGIKLIDNQRRVYFEDGMVLDSVVPLKLKPEEERVPIAGFERDSGSTVAWSVDRTKQPQELVFLKDKPVAALPRLMAWGPDAKVGEVIAVGSGVIVHLDGASHQALTNEMPCTFWWTGESMKVGRELVPFIRQHAAELAKLASPVRNMRAGLVALASDRNGGLWLRTRREQGDRPPLRDPTEPYSLGQVEKLEHFDGKTWHDVQKELGLDLKDYNTALHTADGGKSMLLAVKQGREVRKVTYEKGAGYKLGPGVTSGWVWSVMDYTAFAGSTGQVWLTSSDQRSIKSDEEGLNFISGPAPLLEDPWRITWRSDRGVLTGESKDGSEVWVSELPTLQVLHPWGKDQYLGLSENEAVHLGLKPERGGRRLVVLARFPWGQSRDALLQTYFDSQAGMLWLTDRRGRVSRFKFPAEFVNAR